ncbi:MAG TPA: DNA repair protein RecN [Steroidobacteraceae bacterium]
MLLHLQIRDLAIIDAVEIDFNAGMTVLTGETGAGKSILVDALELLGGGRAGAEVVRSGAERADLSATVDIARVGGALQHVLKEQSIPGEDELLLRRVIGADGRSRAWLNGQSVPVTLLRTIGELLFDIHGQHEFQSLMRPAAQRELLDGFGQLDALAGQVRAAHAAWLALMNRSVAVEAAASDRHARLDLLRYQVQELEGMQLSEGEFAALNEERSRIANSGRLTQAARAALEGLYESEEVNAHQLLARALGSLRAAGALDQRLTALQPPLEEVLARVQDVARELAAYLDSLEFDPQRQEAIEARLAAMEELARKHRVEPAELVAWHGALKRELTGMESAAADLGSLRSQVAAALTAYQTQARELSASRTRAARALGSEVTRRMQDLGMMGGVFIAEVSPLESTEPAAHGADRVEFRVSTNPGHAARAVAKIASGGELARLSLAVQVCCARDAAPCMVFDEVDAGIGGAVAEIVGRELRGLGTISQVLCVTHLAQVACQGHQQLRVAKLTDGRNTRITVAPLSGEARVEEIARMVGGVEITAKTRAHALEMLQQAASAVAPTAAVRRRRGARA